MGKYGLKIDVPGATEEEIQRGLEAVVTFFNDAGLHPVDAFAAAWALETLSEEEQIQIGENNGAEAQAGLNTRRNRNSTLDHTQLTTPSLEAQSVCSNSVRAALTRSCDRRNGGRRRIGRTLSSHSGKPFEIRGNRRRTNCGRINYGRSKRSTGGISSARFFPPFAPSALAAGSLPSYFDNVIGTFLLNLN